MKKLILTSILLVSTISVAISQTTANKGVLTIAGTEIQVESGDYFQSVPDGV